MLFWAEGSKSPNHVTFANTDPEMVALFLEFLRRCYGVTDEQVSVRVNCFLNNGLGLAQIEQWWLDRLGLPSECLRKARVNPERPDRGGKARHPYGTVRVVVHSTFIVQSIFGAIQAYGGFDRPSWLEAEKRAA
jgi:hypothetical protein